MRVRRGRGRDERGGEEGEVELVVVFVWVGVQRPGYYMHDVIIMIHPSPSPSPYTHIRGEYLLLRHSSSFLLERKRQGRS